jgi:hypothetical protein
MSFPNRLSLMSLAVALLASASAFAQSTTGTISGRVTDTQDLGVPGVTVTANAPTLQGTRETVTSENGDYILTVLPTGVYTITFQLSGFGEQTRTVTVAVGQSVPLSVQMGPAALSETVNVVASRADVLTDTAQVGTNFTQSLMNLLPTGRDLNATLLMAPGVRPSGPGGNFSINGSVSFENLFLVNGVTMNENVRGTAPDLYIEDAVQETSVATAGVSAEFGRFTGGVVNVITKSGGNSFSGSFRDTLNNDNWRKKTPFEETAIGGQGGADLRIDKVVPTYEYTFGGPVMRDKLWFFVAGRLQKQESGRNTAITSIPYTFIQDNKRFEYKGSYAADSNHRFVAAYTKSFRTEENYTFNQNASMDLASLGTRELPEDLFTANYTGVLTSKLFVEGRVSRRQLSFIGTGSRFTDLEKGTLLLDRSRGNTRYWSDTFCGVCTPYEQRDNQDFFAKGTYFLSTSGAGSHSMTFGYDNFNDVRQANNHQSGSDYRILGTSTIIQGTNVFPQFLGNGTTLIQWNPILVDSFGSSFRTHSMFYNDAWRVTDRLTTNLGLRYDKNDGKDQAGNTVITEAAWSPRLGFVFDPLGNDRWSVTGSVAKYVTAVANSIADASSAAGNPQTRQFAYRGADINPPGTANPVTSDVAIRQVFAWYNANGGASLPLVANPTIPGVTPIIGDLASPDVWEYATGVNRQFGSRAAIRADFVYRDYGNFYADFTTPGSVARDPEGRTYDLITIGNDNDLAVRKYAGLSLQGTYRRGSFDVGGNYTVSRNWGNVEGETVTNGPIRFTGTAYSEYKREEWNYPVGDLSSDQRHRSRVWLNYNPSFAPGLTLSMVEIMESGVPYGGGGREALVIGSSTSGVDPRPYLANPGYLSPPPGTDVTYFYTARDAFRTQGQMRTDFGATYAYKVPRAGNTEIFVQVQVLNLFNQFQLCACGGTAFGTGSPGNAGGVNIQRLNMAILTPVSTPARFAAFNPYTTTPVQGVNWDYGPIFGLATSRFAYTTPQSARITFGVRF